MISVGFSCKWIQSFDRFMVSSLFLGRNLNTTLICSSSDGSNAAAAAAAAGDVSDATESLESSAMVVDVYLLGLVSLAAEPIERLGVNGVFVDGGVKVWTTDFFFVEGGVIPHFEKS